MNDRHNDERGNIASHRLHDVDKGCWSRLHERVIMKVLGMQFSYLQVAMSLAL